MKYDCSVIKDLLPLYADNAVSPKTREVVEEHLRGCESCSEFLAVIRRSSRRRLRADAPAESQAMRNIAKMMRRRRLRIAGIITGIVVFAIAWVMIMGVNMRVWTSDMEIIDGGQARLECQVIDITDEEFELMQTLFDSAAAQAEETGETERIGLGNSQIQFLMEELDIGGAASGGTYYPESGMAYVTYYDAIYGYDLTRSRDGTVSKTVRMPENGDVGAFQKTYSYLNINNEEYQKYTSRVDLVKTIKANLGIK